MASFKEQHHEYSLIDTEQFLIMLATPHWYVDQVTIK
jgi:hypothetical protein